MNSKVNVVLFVLIALMLFGLVFAQDLNYNDSNYNQDNSDSNFIVGNDRDEHGCIPSAGDSWCEEKQKCLRVWEEKCDSNYNSESRTIVGEDVNSWSNCVCTMEYAPVCGKNGKTYGNKCVANCERAEIAYIGECKEIEGSSCNCTKEYNPVCALVNPDQCICSPGAICKCSSKKKTFANKCLAECERGVILSQGPCSDENIGEIQNDESIQDFCGGIAAIPCKEGYVCKLEGDYPDAGGKCVYDCPIYMPPLCREEESVSVKIDEYGCKNPVCSKIISTSFINASNFYFGANWVCSNGEEFKEKSDKCMPYAYWKEKARKTCAQFSVKCDETKSVNQIQKAPMEKQVPLTGNFLLDVIKMVTPDTVRSKEIVENENRSISEDSNMVDSNVNLDKCIGGSVYVLEFELSEACKPQCKVVIDSQGCENISCDNGETKRYCASECIKQSIEEISALKEKCHVNNGQVIVNTNESGCVKYFCDKEIELESNDLNGIFSDSNTACTLLDEIPKEKYAYCENNGGKLLVKTNKDNCVTFLECVGQSEYSSDLNAVNKEVIKDSIQLLGIALKLEELKVELNKTSLKVLAISNYYKEIGDFNASIKFENIVDLLNVASNEINSIKSMIKERANNFTENDAIEVKLAVRSVKTEILNKVLMELLE